MKKFRYIVLCIMVLFSWVKCQGGEAIVDSATHVVTAVAGSVAQVVPAVVPATVPAISDTVKEMGYFFLSSGMNHPIAIIALLASTVGVYKMYELYQRYFGNAIKEVEKEVKKVGEQVEKGTTEVKEKIGQSETVLKGAITASGTQLSRQVIAVGAEVNAAKKESTKNFEGIQKTLDQNKKKLEATLSINHDKIESAQQITLSTLGDFSDKIDKMETQVTTLNGKIDKNQQESTDQCKKLSEEFQILVQVFNEVKENVGELSGAAKRTGKLVEDLHCAGLPECVEGIKEIVLIVHDRMSQVHEQVEQNSIAIGSDGKAMQAVSRSMADVKLSAWGQATQESKMKQLDQKFAAFEKNASQGRKMLETRINDLEMAAIEREHVRQSAFERNFYLEDENRRLQDENRRLQNENKLMMMMTAYLIHTPPIDCAKPQGERLDHAIQYSVSKQKIESTRQLFLEGPKAGLFDGVLKSLTLPFKNTE